MGEKGADILGEDPPPCGFVDRAMQREHGVPSRRLVAASRQRRDATRGGGEDAGAPAMERRPAAITRDQNQRAECERDKGAGANRRRRRVAGRDAGVGTHIIGRIVAALRQHLAQRRHADHPGGRLHGFGRALAREAQRERRNLQIAHIQRDIEELIGELYAPAREAGAGGVLAQPNVAQIEPIVELAGARQRGRLQSQRGLGDDLEPRRHQIADEEAEAAIGVETHGFHLLRGRCAGEREKKRKGEKGGAHRQSPSR